MANPSDVEHQAEHTEETPLLHEDTSVPQHADRDGPEKKRGITSYIWGILWAVFAVATTTIFVKAWIDGGSDVDVSDISVERDIS